MRKTSFLSATLAVLAIGCGNGTSPCGGDSARCPMDAVATDSIAIDAVSMDTAPTDTAEAGDTSDTGIPAGSFGAPCTSDVDCTSGICLTSLGRCSRACAGRMDCPMGSNWACAGIPGRGPVCNCTPQSATEIPCNGVDDDCDGLIDPGDSVCNGACVDLSSSNANCGACGIACAGGSVCSHGTCQCPPSRPTVCGTECLDTNNDPMHCGSCTNACPSIPNATTACVAGACGAVCNAGFGNCDGNMSNGCETDLRTTPQNCGMCGRACTFANANASCSTGTCVMGMCNAGFSDCDGSSLTGCESMTVSDPMNCGSCGHACTAPNATSACSSGVCMISACASGYGNCNGLASDGCEITLRSDPRNCGVCGGACPGLSSPNTTATCTAGTCGFMCATGFADCDANPANGCEASINTAAHCGSCTTACPTGMTCSGGTCSTCPAGQTFCGGSCISVTSDPANCGSCGNTCATGASCSGGVCACPSGEIACGTSCIATGSDPNNCGGCGVVCPAGQTCVSATCVTAGTCTSAVDISAGGTFMGNTCGESTAFNTTCGGAGAPVYYFEVNNPAPGLSMNITVSPPTYAVELELPCGGGHNGCMAGNLSISFGGGSVWGIAVQSTTPGACGAFTITVTVR